jgi:hypothetical protein
MRRVFSVRLRITAALILILGIAVAERKLRPSPVVAGGMRESVTARATDASNPRR